MSVVITVVAFFVGFGAGKKEGYKDGVNSALKTNPPSNELEMVCAGLWIGEQNKKYWNKNK
jgi:hypothetical protein